MANTYLTRTNTSPTSAYKCTYSGWIKRSKLGSRQRLMTVVNPSSSGAYCFIEFTSDDFLGVNDYDGVSAGGIGGQTTSKFRDTNGWMHIVAAFDTTQSTGTNRLKVYVNGVEESSFSFSGTGSQNRTLSASVSGKTQYIGAYQSGFYWDGSMSHVNFVDGLQLDASAFGETDTTTGQWKIKTSPTVSEYGNNGFFILKDGNSVTDQSGKGNNFTVGGGTLTKTEDNPSNVFCTANPLARYSGNLNYSNGNNTTTGSANAWTMGSSTMGASTGKWYYEYKLTTVGTGSGYFKMGFISDQAFANNTGHIAESGLDGGYAFYCSNGNLEVRTDDAVISGYDQSTLATSFSMGDIMCLAVDMDNKRAYFRKNDGAWIKSANPATGTNGLDISADYTAGKAMIPAFSIYYPGVASINFGNGYFGTTAVSSAGTNASGIGIFEYDVPTGYTALSTKGLNL